MKLTFSCLLACLSLLSPAHADILCSAPGVPAGAVKATKCPFKLDYVLVDCYKFVFRGIEAKGATLGAPGNSGTNGNGGQFHLRADVSGVKLGKIEFRNVQEFNVAPLITMLLPETVVFRATDSPISVAIEWKGEGNAHKPDGFFNILGEYQKHPVPPVGSLYFAVGDFALTPAGANPPGTATIIRE